MPSSHVVVKPDTFPEALRAELRAMRRNPDEFTVNAMVKCKFCSGGKGSKTAHSLVHPKNLTGVGTWCAIHGWLYFDSVKVRCIGDPEPVRRPERQKKAA